MHAFLASLQKLLVSVWTWNGELPRFLNDETNDTNLFFSSKIHRRGKICKSQCTFPRKGNAKSILSYFFMSSIVSYVTRYILSWNINGSNRKFGQLDFLRSPTTTSIIFTLRRASLYSPSEWSETYINSLCDTVYVNLSPSKCHMNT